MCYFSGRDPEALWVLGKVWEKDDAVGISILLIYGLGYAAWLVDHVLFLINDKLQKEVIFLSYFNLDLECMIP